MSAAFHPSTDLPCAGLRMTAEEFLALGETEQRLELVDGVVVVSPSPVPLHQKVARHIFGQLVAAAEALPGLELYYETDVVLAPRLVYCPDMALYAPGRLSTTPARLDLPPDLVIEILSPETRRKDLVTKRADYERHGVGEYWIVEPRGVVALVLTREGDAFTESPAPLVELASRAIPGVRVDLNRVRRALT